MPKYIQLPDGGLFPLKDGENPLDAMTEAQRLYPKAFGILEDKAPEKAPESGFTPALKAGFKNLKGDVAALAGRAGLMDTEAAEAYKAQQEAEAKKIFKPTEQGWTEAPITKLKELAGGSLPYMAAPAAAGAAALLLPEAAAAAPVLGGLMTAGEAAGAAGAGLASAAQFTGSNLSRQMEAEGKTLAETDLGAAALAAVPQAALDVVSLKMIPGVRNILAAGGRKVTEEAAQAAAQQGIKNIAADYLKATGKTMSIEGLTEAGQQVFERLQAGLSVTDPEARKEYFDNFLGGAVLGGVLAPGGHYVERGQAQAEAQRRKQEEDAKAAAAAAAEESAKAAQENAALEAKRQTPEHISDIVTRFDAIKSKHDELKKQADAKVNKDDIDAVYAKDQAKQQLDALKNSDEYKTLLAERKAIAPYMQQYKAAQALTYPTSNVLDLSDKYQQLQQQLDNLHDQYTQGADIPTQQKLETQMEEVQAHMNDLAPAIERMGGSTMTAEQIQKALAESEKKRLDAMTLGDVTAAKKHAAEIQDLTKRLETARKVPTGRGESIALFAEEPVQPEAEGIKYAAYPKDEEVDLAAKPTKPIEPFPATAAEAFALPQVKQTEQETLQTAQTRAAKAQQQLDEVVKSTGGKNTAALYQAIDAVNKAQDTVSRAHQNVGRVPLKTTVLDLFDPATVLRTALNNGDTKTLNDMAAHADRQNMRQALDQASTDRERLINVLDSKLNLEGTTRERADLFSKTYTPKQQAQFKNGTNNEVIERVRRDDEGNPIIGKDGKPEMERIKLQDVYDQGGPAAVDYENVLDAVQELSRKVTTRQGNAKYSLYQQLVNLANDHQSTLDDIASKNKTLEDGTVRPMTKREMTDAKKRAARLEAEFKALEKRIIPTRDEIKKLWDSLYTTTPAKKPSVAAERAKAEKEARAERSKPLKKIAEKHGMNSPEFKAAMAEEVEKRKAAGLVPKPAKSRTAATAARIERGDVRYEAENSAQMRQLAITLGQEETEYDTFGDKLLKRVQALEAKYGKHDPASIKARIDMAKALEDKAIELGKKTPEYKATLKEQTEIVREALSQSKQTLKTKRTPQVTRKQSGAPKELRVGGSKMTAREIEAEVRAANEADGGTAYRLGEAKPETTVDAAEAQKVIDGLKLPENVKFVYAPTAGKIPVRLLNMMAKDGVDPTQGMVQGAVFPDGTILVVGDQHANVKDLEETIAHEIIGHYGIDTVIGHERLNSFLKGTDVIELARRLGGDALVQEVLNTVRANADLGRSEAVQKLQALREIIAHTAEAKVTESFREKAGRWLKELVGMVRAGLRAMGLKNLTEMSTSDVFYMLKQSRKAFANKTIGPYKAADGSTAFRRRTEPSEYGIGRPAGVMDNLLGNMMGLAGRVQFVDQYAALEAAIKKGLDAKVVSSLEAVNANYLLRFGQQRSQFAGQFLTNGPVKAIHTKKDGGVETVYKSTKGVSMMDVAKKVGESGIGNDTEQEDMFTLYLAGKRAGQVGWDKLNYSNPADAKAKYDKMMAKVNADPKAKKAFEEAAKLYQEYNAGLLDFLVDTGALSREKANELKSISYVPFYRINGDGEVQLVIDKEKSPIRIANIKDQPQLQQLVGGNTEIMPIFTTAAQNTFMLTGMGLRNQAVKETSFMLQKLGIASRVSEGMGPKDANVVRFFKHGQPYYALIDKDQYGIPADLIVKGMEGIKTSMPAIVKAMGIPSQLLRNFVVRMPTYALRQVIRDPLNAWLTTGTDATPILSSMKELAHMVAGRSEAETKLMESGAISSNVYSGDEADMGKFLQDIAAGKSMWEKALGRLDAFALQGDAATRAVIYKDSLAKGMSEQEALLRTLESMNFSRRGVSPSMHALSVMIPFFNAQVQGLDVIYRAFKGDMPFSEQTKIRQKMVQRGLMLAAGTIAYAAMMEDDEAYKRAKPSERYSNWFVYVPGVSEPVRVPIPFEMGFLFKALPEAVWNAAAQDEDAGKAAKGLASVFAQTIPNPVPQALKPGVEAVLGKSFYGGDIESTREKEQLATDRYRENTTELSKMIGSITGHAGVSPIMLDHLIRGYTGGLGVALVQLANPILASDTQEVAQPSTKPSKLPLIGGLFQPVEGRGTLDEAYDRMTEIRQIKGTYNKLVEEGRRAEAKEFAQNYAKDLAEMSLSGTVQQRLGAIAKMERQVRASPQMTTEQKDAKLEQLDKMKTDLARKFLAQR